MNGNYYCDTHPVVGGRNSLQTMPESPSLTPTVNTFLASLQQRCNQKVLGGEQRCKISSIRSMSLPRGISALERALTTSHPINERIRINRKFFVPLRCRFDHFRSNIRE